jgi:hypothetical protein
VGRDPISEQGGINLYAFVFNGPSNGWDFMGMNPESESPWYYIDDSGFTNLSLTVSIADIIAGSKGAPTTTTTPPENKNNTPQDATPTESPGAQPAERNDRDPDERDPERPNNATQNLSIGTVLDMTGAYSHGYGVGIDSTREVSDRYDEERSRIVDEATEWLEGLTHEEKMSICSTFLNPDNDIYSPVTIQDSPLHDPVDYVQEHGAVIYRTSTGGGYIDAGGGPLAREVENGYIYKDTGEFSSSLNSPELNIPAHATSAIFLHSHPHSSFTDRSPPSPGDTFNFRGRSAPIDRRLIGSGVFDGNSNTFSWIDLNNPEGLGISFSELSERMGCQ